MTQRLGALTALPEAPTSIPTSSQLSVTIVPGHSSSGPYRESGMHVAHRCTYNPNTDTYIIMMMMSKNNSNSRIFKKKATTWKKLNFQNIWKQK